MSGTLFVVATPIGNLEDLSTRTRQTLAEVDLVPRHELDAHLAALERLTETMRDLERRVAALEADS